MLAPMTPSLDETTHSVPPPTRPPPPPPTTRCTAVPPRQKAQSHAPAHLPPSPPKGELLLPPMPTSLDTSIVENDAGVSNDASSNDARIATATPSSSHAFTVRYVAKDVWRVVTARAGCDVGSSTTRMLTADAAGWRPVKVKDLLIAAVAACGAAALDPSMTGPEASSSSSSSSSLSNKLQNNARSGTTTSTRRFGAVRKANLTAHGTAEDGKTRLMVTADSHAVERQWLCEYGLYVPSRGHWLEHERDIAEYRLTACSTTATGDIIELQYRQHFIRTHALYHYAEGWLSKKGDRSIKWLPRYVILRNRTLFYYKQRGDAEPLGTIDLSKRKQRQDGDGDGYTVAVVEEHGGPSLAIGRCFQIEVHGVKTYRFMAGDRADARNWVRVLQTLEEEVPALRTRQPAVVAVEAAAGADASADKKMNVGATHRQLPDLDEPMCALPSYGSSDDSENNDNAVVGRGREYSSEESEGDAIAGTFGHLRLSEAMRKSSLQQHRRRSGDAASSLNKETLASSLVAKETLAQCHGIGHVDIQGDKIGYLYKKGSFNTSLRYRLFVLRDKVLYYYKPTSTSSSATTTTTAKTLTNTNYTFAGYINIEGGRVYGEHKIAPNRKHPAHVFRIVTPGRVYVLSTGEEDEWQDWREAFEFISGVVVEDGSVFTAADWQELERGGGGDGGTESPVDGRTAAADSSDEGRTHGCIGGNIVKPHKIKLRLDFQKLGSPELEGILLKQGNDRMRKWRRRWFTLVGRSLFYGYVENRYEPIGTIPLSMCTLERGGEDTTSATSSTSALLSASHSSMNSAVNAVPTSYAFDLVVRNEDLEQPVLRTYHLKVDDTDSFTYARWVRKLAVHTGASDARVRELLA